VVGNAPVQLLDPGLQRLHVAAVTRGVDATGDLLGALPELRRVELADLEQLLRDPNASDS
jgi:hypothetical protein